AALGNRTPDLLFTSSCPHRSRQGRLAFAQLSGSPDPDKPAFASAEPGFDLPNSYQEWIMNAV
ncbi:hypothetical protein AB0C08_38385, partial [Microbispora bryophytorum]|uniref:hypothetical protein n=1 Tax=Microbispora bryophytorum TaxID=1460882 RepID=UPI0033C0155C